MIGSTTTSTTVLRYGLKCGLKMRIYWKNQRIIAEGQNIIIFTVVFSSTLIFFINRLEESGRGNNQVEIAFTNGVIIISTTAS